MRVYRFVLSVGDYGFEVQGLYIFHSSFCTFIVQGPGFRVLGLGCKV